MAPRRRAAAAFILAAALAAATRPGLARTEGVALTFDDAPGLSLDSASTEYLRATNSKLIGGLRARRFPAIAFVIGEKLEGPDRAVRTALVNAWLDAGFEVGNHTYSHESLNKTPLAAYEADVAKDDAVLRPLLAAHGKRLRWFRHPYLDTGASLADKQAFEAWLAKHGYRVAPVTIENADWMFALPYDEAVLKGDAAEAARIRKAYVDYTARVVGWYRKAALDLLGRRPALVFLLHDTRLNADTLGELAKILKHNDLTPVSLDKAMRDPAYKLPETVLDTNGDEWLSRWSLTLKRDLPWDSFPEPPADIAAAEARLDSEP
jgi:peptidoglycan/xylan/chitin deacetylase (PgdA/CDA1 family)